MSTHVTLSRADLIESSKDKPLGEVVMTDLRQDARNRMLPAERVTIKDGDEEHAMKDRGMSKSRYSFLQEAPILLRTASPPPDETDFITPALAQDVAMELLPDGYEMQFKVDRRDAVIKGHVTLRDTEGNNQVYDVATEDQLRAAIHAFLSADQKQPPPPHAS